MNNFENYEVWFITGAQLLYGGDAVVAVDGHSNEMVKGLNKSGNLPVKVVYKGTVNSSKEVTEAFKKANNDDKCIGVITWMHTFSPAKMWIHGLQEFRKPLLHLHTQFNEEIPWNTMDMDFMNLNQSAHGDREHGFIGARLRLSRKIAAGHYSDPVFRQKVADFTRSAAGVYESRKLKVCRFGDNMRNVAVTEGDKVEAEIKLGWSVNTWGVGDLIKLVNGVTDSELKEKMDEYKNRYTLPEGSLEAVEVQAKMDVAIGKFMKKGGFGAFTDTFEDLQELRQLPGLATQNLMYDGFGFGGEGDWKTAAMVRIMKLMSEGLNGGTCFMEDYTYHLDPDNEGVLGAHMLEVDPSIAVTKPAIEVHPLGIGDREPPARLCFEAGEGGVIIASLIDVGGRFRLIVAEAKAVKPFQNMPKLPVAQVMWKPLPDLSTSAEAWILAGGAHHTVMSYSLSVQNMADFAEFLGVEFIHIGAHTKIEDLKKELMWNDLAFKFSN